MEDTKATETVTTEYQDLNLSIIKIRCKLQEQNLKKSGYNRFANFSYFELADFLPTLNKLMLEENVNDLFTIEDGVARLTLMKGIAEQTYEIPFVMFPTPLNQKGQKSMQDIQYLGALNTYYKRYLYLNAFGITDGDVIDAMDNQSLSEENTQKQAKTKPQSTPQHATKSQVDKIMQLVSDIDAMLKYYNVEKVEDLTVQQASEIISKKSKSAIKYGESMNQ